MARAWRRRVLVVMGIGGGSGKECIQRRDAETQSKKSPSLARIDKLKRVPPRQGELRGRPQSRWSFEEGVGEDGGDGDVGVVASDGSVDIGQAVVIAAGLVERGGCLGIAGEGAGGGQGDAGLDGFEGAIEPPGKAVVAEQEAIAGLGESAAAEGQDGGASAFDGADVLADDHGLDTAEFGFAAGGEDLGDGGMFGSLNLGVGIEEAPAQAMGEMAADGGLAGSHEADDVDSGGALELEVHAVPLMDAMRDSTIEGKRRMASTRSQPERGVTTVRASRSTPRRMASAHCSAVMAKRRAFCTFSGDCPARTFFWNPVFT